MNASVLTRSALALFTFAGVVACSAAPETIGTSSSDVTSVGVSQPPVESSPPPPPTPPVWPPPNPTYCGGISVYENGDLGCGVSPSSRWNDVGAATLVSLGCIPAQGLDGTAAYPLGVGFSVCFDTPAVRAQLSPLAISCDRCLPALPAGELYVFVGAPQHKPTCPSGCPSGNGNPIGRIGASGSK